MLGNVLYVRENDCLVTTQLDYWTLKLFEVSISDFKHPDSFLNTSVFALSFHFLKGAAKPAKDGIIKCTDFKGWSSKPESLECLRKVVCFYSR